MLKKLLLLILLSLTLTQEQSISNLNVGQLTDGSGLIQVTYDLNDNAGTFASFNVEVQVSIDGAEYETYSGSLVSGDVGENVIPGIGKILYIQAPDETYSNNVIVKIIASAYTITSELPFTMISISSTEGVSSYQGESISYNYEIMQNEMTNAELVTFLETYQFALDDNQQPIYNCSNYTEYFHTGPNNNDYQIQCDDPNALNPNSDVDCVYENQVGCTDPDSFNFSHEAIYYDCSCYTTYNSYSESNINTQNCDWSEIGSDEEGYYIDINDDGMYDFITQNGSKIVFQACSDSNANNFPVEIVNFFQENSINSDCFEIEDDGSCMYDCNEDYLGNQNNEDSDYGNINIENFSTDAISFEGSSFIIESGLGTQPAIFNYNNCVDGVIVGLLLEYYGLRIPTGSEWTKAARQNNTRCWPWLSGDCQQEAEIYCSSIYTCMSEEEYDACEESANDLMWDCQDNCAGGGNEDECNACMMENGMLCGGDPCGNGCPCCDNCMSGGTMDCMQECQELYGDPWGYCNGEEVNECNWCMEQSQDCESTNSSNLEEFLDDSNYDDDDNDGIWTSYYDQHGFYKHVFSGRFFYYLANDYDHENPSLTVTDVGQFPTGISAFGLYDMIGNAPEIVKYNDEMWLAGLTPTNEYIGSFCENDNTMFDDNTMEAHASKLDINDGEYFNLYGLRLIRTIQD